MEEKVGLTKQDPEITGKKAVERKDTRFERRLKERKQESLNKLVLDFFTQRSAILDPNGEEAAELFTKFRNMWLAECKKHNKLRSPLKLNYDAFQKQVDEYLKMEKQNIAMSEASNRVKDFPHWLRRSRVWRTRPFTCILYQIRAKFNQERFVSLWREYYLEVVIPTMKKEFDPIRPNKPEGYYTCDNCSAKECEHAFDEYNTNGDCLAVK